MSQDKSQVFSRYMPIQTAGIKSPRRFAKDGPLAKDKKAPASNGLPHWQRGEQTEEYTDGYGNMDEGVATPINKTILNSNITPRSGSRKARAETASPTTNGVSNDTPGSSRPASSLEHDDRRAANGLGLRISHAGKKSRTDSMVSGGGESSVSVRSAMKENDNLSQAISSPDHTPKFFYANDMKANAPSRQVDASNGRPLTAEFNSREQRKPNFSDADAYREQNVDSLRAGVNDFSFRPPLQTIYSAQNANSPPQASSPLKDEVVPRIPSLSKASPRRHTRLVSNGGTELRSPDGVPQANGDIRRRSSLTSPRQAQYSTHTRSSSVQSVDSSPPYRRLSASMSGISPIERAKTMSVVGSNGALPHSVNPPAITQEVPKSPGRSQPHSPTKPDYSGKSKIDHLNELAANARRERKVLDLEISNSSLLAINRTLEREMRKQNAELRRYRRLSRSGRISIAPSSRSVSGVVSIISQSDTVMDVDDLVSSSDEDQSTQYSSDVSSSRFASHSPSSSQSAARNRFHDPKRIQLDLAAHRALLLDSQKLNTSIRRCLSYSEAMISSAKQALKHHVQALEPGKVGARVLTPDDVDEDVFSRGQGLLSPSLDCNDTNPWERSLKKPSALEDGLKTPDYSQWGPATGTEGQFPLMDTVESVQDPTVDDGKPMSSAADESDAIPGSIEADEERRVSLIPSLDGLDDDLGVHEIPDARGTSVERVDGANGRQEPLGAREEGRRDVKLADSQMGQPGYRGSMQGLGHYLQAFSIFGTSQQT